MAKLKSQAKELGIGEIPPIAVLNVATPPLDVPTVVPECTYFSALACAFVLRADIEEREFVVKASGAREFAFACVHGECEIKKTAHDTALVKVKKSSLSPTNRVDVAVFGKNPGTGWGAPSFVSFSAVDPDAPYSDPFLTPQRAD